MHIAFLARFDLNDVNRGSGSFYYMIREMRAQGHQVDIPAPVNPPLPLLCRMRNRFYRQLISQRYHPHLDVTFAKQLGLTASQQIAQVGCDMVITNDPAITAFCTSRKPIVIITDWVFQAVVDWGRWDGYTNLCTLNHQDGKRIWDTALQRSCHTFFPSEWACQSATTQHGADPAKVHFVRWGANLDAATLGETKLIRIESERSVPTPSDCRLLFVGRDWNHKGGDTALETVKRLRENNVNAHLTVVGSNLLRQLDADAVTVIPHLNKENAEDRKVLVNLYNTSHFFLLPTRAEAYGIAFIEASAFGLPSISYNHTGVSSSVVDGVTGVLLEPDASAFHFAQEILALIEQPMTYQSMCRSARLFFERETNWTTAIKTIFETLKFNVR